MNSKQTRDLVVKYVTEVTPREETRVLSKKFHNEMSEGNLKN